MASAIDSGPNHLTGAVTGTLTYSNNLPPHGGGRFSLNATADYDYVTVPDASVLYPTGSFRLSAWAYPTGGQNSSGVGDAIVDKHQSFYSGDCIESYGLYYNASTGNFYAQICGSTNPSASNVVVASKDAYPLGQ